MHDVFLKDIHEFYYTNKAFTKNNKQKSFGICDLIIDNEEEILILENQNKRKKYFEERSMAYLSKAYSEQWLDHLYHFKKVILCWTLNYKYRIKELQEYQLLETELHENFKDLFTVKIWNVTSNHQSEEQKKWASLFHITQKNLEPLHKDPKFKPIVEAVITYNLNKEEYQKMKEVENMWTQDDERKIDMAIAFDEGVEKGERKGKK